MFIHWTRQDEGYGMTGFFSPWWRQQATLGRIAHLAEELLSAEAQYNAVVHARTVAKRGLYGLLLEIDGPFGLDGRAIRTLRSSISDRLMKNLGIQLKAAHVHVVFHDCSRKLSRDARRSLEGEIDRCRRLHGVQILQHQQETLGTRKSGAPGP